MDKENKIKMDKEIKYNLYIGLNTQDKKKLNKKDVMNKVSNIFINYGIFGFNLTEMIGFWEGEKEESIKISFINTFHTTEDLMNHIVMVLKREFNQQCILLEKEEIEYNFI